MDSFIFLFVFVMILNIFLIGYEFYKSNFAKGFVSNDEGISNDSFLKRSNYITEDDFVDDSHNICDPSNPIYKDFCSSSDNYSDSNICDPTNPLYEDFCSVSHYDSYDSDWSSSSSNDW
ncbi:MAG: hypothetical protein ACP5KF_02930 [Sulfurihydrogenibium sp.]